MCSVARPPAFPFRFVAITLAFILQACGGGGSVSGLFGSGLQLQSGGTTLSVAANGPSTFPAEVASGTNYSVSVSKQPSNPAQTCTVSNAAGMVSANVTGILVGCTTNSYRLGGSVSGLAGSGLVLRDQGGTTVSIASNGAFSFAAPVPSGTNYPITVASQPTNPVQTCTVGNGSGPVVSADIASVDIACATVITADTAASITTLGNTVSESLMQFASFMGERLTYLSSHLAPTVTETCSVPFVGATTHIPTTGTSVVGQFR